MRKIKELELKIEELEQRIWGLEHHPKFKNGSKVIDGPNTYIVVNSAISCALPYGFTYEYRLYNEKVNSISAMYEHELMLEYIKPII